MIQAGNPFPVDAKVTLYDGNQAVQDAVVPANGDDIEIIFRPLQQLVFWHRV